MDDSNNTVKGLLIPVVGQICTFHLLTSKKRSEDSGTVTQLTKADPPKLMIQDRSVWKTCGTNSHAGTKACQAVNFTN